MTSAPTPPTRLWPWVIVLLLALRLPSVVEPVGNDQNLYLYIADQIRHGGVPYVDAWDQKPPGIDFLYAGLRSVWPHPSVVAAADLAAAAVVAILLVVLGRWLVDATVGYLAAALVILLGDPSIARLSGVYVRGQCETFIAVAASAALVAIGGRSRRPWQSLAAGAWLGVAFWLKYNAAAYAIPVVAALVLWPARSGTRMRAVLADLGLLAGGSLAVSLLPLAFFAAHHALGPLSQATLAYNLAYARETYVSGPLGAIGYLVTMPLRQARTDLLWFLGLAGAGMFLVRGWQRSPRSVALTIGWIAAAILSIAINGARDLPQYFVQAHAPLALAAAAGLTAAWRGGTWWRVAGAALLLVGLLRVGVQLPTSGALRLGGLPQAIDNDRFDVAYLIGHVTRDAYLSRFKGGQKYDALAIDALTTYVTDHTAPTDRILVFGFAPAVYVDSGRLSASRFFWSRPVIAGFDADRPDYGARGLLTDLERTPPAVVALQRKDWSSDVGNSLDFFLGDPALHAWLSAGYLLDQDGLTFSVWRRRL